MYQTRKDYAGQSNMAGAGDTPAPAMWVGFQPDIVSRALKACRTKVRPTRGGAGFVGRALARQAWRIPTGLCRVETRPAGKTRNTSADRPKQRCARSWLTPGRRHSWCFRCRHRHRTSTAQLSDPRQSRGFIYVSPSKGQKRDAPEGAGSHA